jgi:hypothetical protein
MVGDCLSTRCTLGGAIAAELCAGSKYAQATGRVGFGMVYRRAHAAVDRLVTVEAFAADPAENLPVFCPAYSKDIVDRRFGTHPRNTAVG